MSVCFNAPPGWPVPSASWAPDDDWMPDPSWPTPPRGWTFWTVSDHGDAPRADLALLEAAGIDARAFGTQRLDTQRLDAPRLDTPRFGTPPRTTAATYGTDRGTWLAGLRSRASSEFLETATASSRRRAPSSRDAADTSWELDGLVTSAGRLDL
jgi:hypothetical protein